MCVFGKVDLGGEVRPVSFIEKRLNEGNNLGFSTAIYPNIKHITSAKLEIKILTNIKKFSL